jgi:FtsH-binding integral membrane protein
MRLRWIPPFGMIAGHIAHGASWLILLWVATSGEGVSLGPATLAWIHVVVLAWFSVIALSVLTHALPTFTRTQWPQPLAVRFVLFLVVVLSVALVISFALWNMKSAEMIGGLFVLSLLAYVVLAAWALSPALAQGPRARRFVAVGFIFATGMFALTALLGTMMASALAGHMGPQILAHVPAVHAHIGVLLWLTSLVFGVAVRTYNPIFDAPENDVTSHRRIAPPFTLGAIIAIVGMAFDWRVVVIAGAVIAAIGTLSFAGYTISIARRATVRHRLPHAFIVTANILLVLATLLALGTALGAPWAAAYLYVGLIGWLGMMVLGHMHHIGVRLILTVRLGEDDETRPEAVLVPALGWLTFTLYVLAVIAGTWGTVGLEGGLFAAGILGFAAWLVMSVNLASASRRAGRLRDSGR